MFNATKTIYNKQLENRRKCGIPYTPIINTTLNEKFDIHPLVPTDGKYPLINLLTIGTGNSLDNTNYRLDMRTGTHSPVDAVLFQHLPFYMRRADDVQDLLTNPPSDKLRLKKIITFNSIDYIVYYGYEITNFEYKDDIVKFTNIQNTYANIGKYEIIANDVLNPSVRTSIDLTSDDKIYISDFIKIYTFISEEELIEIKHAHDIMYTGRTAIITEIGVCTSIEQEISNELVNTNVQVAYFLDVKKNVELAIIDKKLDFYIEIGDMEVIVV